MSYQYELGSMGVVVALFVAFCMLVFGFLAVPAPVRVTVVAAGVMFLGWEIVEFILQEFVVIARWACKT